MIACMRRLNDSYFYELIGKYFLADQFNRLLEINNKFFMEAWNMPSSSETMIEQCTIVDEVTGEPITLEQRAAMFKLITERKNIQ